MHSQGQAVSPLISKAMGDKYVAAWVCKLRIASGQG